LGRDVVDEYRDAVAALQKSPLGPRHPDTLAARYGLADALAASGELADALKEHEAVWIDRKEVLSPTHKKTLRSQYLVGAILLSMKKPEEAAEAERHFREVLPLQLQGAREGRISPDEVFRTRAGLAAAAGAIGHHAESAAQNRELIADMEKSGANPEDILTARNNLARALMESGELAAAESELDKVLERAAPRSPNAAKARAIEREIARRRSQPE
jgi:tetratricopeptide (TPR) repeat protein